MECLKNEAPQSNLEALHNQPAASKHRLASPLQWTHALVVGGRKNASSVSLVLGDHFDRLLFVGIFGHTSSSSNPYSVALHVGLLPGPVQMDAQSVRRPITNRLSHVFNWDRVQRRSNPYFVFTLFLLLREAATFRSDEQALQGQ